MLGVLPNCSRVSRSAPSRRFGGALCCLADTAFIAFTGSPCRLDCWNSGTLAPRRREPAIAKAVKVVKVVQEDWVYALGSEGPHCETQSRSHPRIDFRHSAHPSQAER